MLYTTAQVCGILHVKRSNLYNLQRRAKVRPTLGRDKEMREYGPHRNFYDPGQLVILRREIKRKEKT